MVSRNPGRCRNRLSQCSLIPGLAKRLSHSARNDAEGFFRNCSVTTERMDSYCGTLPIGPNKLVQNHVSPAQSASSAARTYHRSLPFFILAVLSRIFSARLVINELSLTARLKNAINDSRRSLFLFIFLIFCINNEHLPLLNLQIPVFHNNPSLNQKTMRIIVRP
jgi:hypothetical protein